MRRKNESRDFEFYIEEYLCYCQSRRLRPKTISSYDQALRLFARWAKEQEQLNRPEEVREQTMRRYIFGMACSNYVYNQRKNGYGVVVWTDQAETVTLFNNLGKEFMVSLEHIAQKFGDTEKEKRKYY